MVSHPQDDGNISTLSLPGIATIERERTATASPEMEPMSPSFLEELDKRKLLEEPQTSTPPPQAAFRRIGGFSLPKPAPAHASHTIAYAHPHPPTSASYQATSAAPSMSNHGDIPQNVAQMMLPQTMGSSSILVPAPGQSLAPPHYTGMPTYPHLGLLASATSPQLAAANHPAQMPLTNFHPPSPHLAAAAPPTHQAFIAHHSPSPHLSAMMVHHHSTPSPVPAPAPVQPVPALVQPAPAPVQPAPAPIQPVPAPVQPAPAPAQSVPAPAQPAPAPAPAPAPVPVPAHPEPTVPIPAPSPQHEDQSNQGRMTNQQHSAMERVFEKIDTLMREGAEEAGVDVNFLVQQWLAISRLGGRRANPWNLYQAYAMDPTYLKLEMGRLVGTDLQWTEGTFPSPQQLKEAYRLFKVEHGDNALDILAMTSFISSANVSSTQRSRRRAFDKACTSLRLLDNQLRAQQGFALHAMLVGTSVNTDSSLGFILEANEAKGASFSESACFVNEDDMLGNFKAHVYQQTARSLTKAGIAAAASKLGCTIADPMENTESKPSAAMQEGDPKAQQEAPKIKVEMVGDDSDGERSFESKVEGKKIEELARDGILAQAKAAGLVFHNNNLSWKRMNEVLKTKGFILYNYPIGIPPPWANATSQGKRKRSKPKSGKGIAELPKTQRTSLYYACLDNAKNRLHFKKANPTDITNNKQPILVYAPADGETKGKSVYYRESLNNVDNDVDSDTSTAPVKRSRKGSRSLYTDDDEDDDEEDEAPSRRSAEPKSVGLQTRAAARAASAAPATPVKARRQASASVSFAEQDPDSSSLTSLPDNDVESEDQLMPAKPKGILKHSTTPSASGGAPQKEQEALQAFTSHEGIQRLQRTSGKKDSITASEFLQGGFASAPAPMRSSAPPKPSSTMESKHLRNKSPAQHTPTPNIQSDNSWQQNPAVPPSYPMHPPPPQQHQGYNQVLQQHPATIQQQHPPTAPQLSGYPQQQQPAISMTPEQFQALFAQMATNMYGIQNPGMAHHQQPPAMHHQQPPSMPPAHSGYGQGQGMGDGMSAGGYWDQGPKQPSGQ